MAHSHPSRMHMRVRISFVDNSYKSLFMPGSQKEISAIFDWRYSS